MGEIIENVEKIYAFVEKSKEWPNIYTVDLVKPIESKRISNVVGIKILSDNVERISILPGETVVHLEGAVSCEVVESFGDNFIKCAKTKKELETIMI
jgi:hypothetical protein